MKRPRSHQIDAQADAYLRQVLAPWVVDRLEHDYGKDYRVELMGAHDSALTGETFLVQLKGTQAPQASAEHVRFTFKTPHLVYYYDRVREPVYLILVDIKQRRAWWLFLQEYVSTVLNSTNGSWRAQKSVTLRLPITNDSVNPEGLRASVNAARRFMDRLRPGSILDAIHAEQQRIAVLDNRFAVGIDAGLGRQLVRLEPRQDFSFTLSISGKNELVRRAMDDLVGRGLEVVAGEVSVSLKGSPLFEMISKDLRSIALCAHLPGEVRLSAVDGSGKETSTLDPICGEFEGGNRELRFAACLGKSPLRVSLKLELQAAGCMVSPSLSFHLAAWDNRQLSALPYFGQVRALFSRLANGDQMVGHVTCEGNDVFRFSGRSQNTGALEEIDRLLIFIDTCRNIAKFLNIDPVLPSGFPDTVSDSTIKSLEILDRLRQSRGIAQRGVFRGASTVRREALVEALQGSPTTSPKRWRVVADCVMELLGVGVTVRKYSLECDVVMEPPADLQEWLSSTSDEPRTIWWRSTGGPIVEDYASIDVAPNHGNHGNHGGNGRES